MVSSPSPQYSFSVAATSIEKVIQVYKGGASENFVSTGGAAMAESLKNREKTRNGHEGIEHIYTVSWVAIKDKGTRDKGSDAFNPDHLRDRPGPSSDLNLVNFPLSLHDVVRLETVISYQKECKLYNVNGSDTE